MAIFLAFSVFLAYFLIRETARFARFIVDLRRSRALYLCQFYCSPSS